MSRLGLDPIDSATFPTFGIDGGQLSDKTVFFSVPYGADFEDAVNVSPTVAIYHFFDPQYNNGAGRGFSSPLLGLTKSAPSPEWSIGTRTLYPNQRHSFQQANDALYAALTSRERSTRDYNAGLMFQSLGHLIHHIQDMAQPQHTRNENHMHGTGYQLLDDGYDLINPGAASYELYTQTQDYRINEILASSPAYPTPEFPSIWDYWSGPGVGKFIGMADFVSKNFVRNDTGYKSLLPHSEVKNQSSEFPLPNGLNRDNTKKALVARACTVIGKETNKTYTTQVMAVVGDIYDEFSRGRITDQLLAVEKSLPHVVTQGGVEKVYNGMAKCVWDEDYKILFPRAVAFSSGLINHFFRGKLEFTRIDSRKWLIKNASKVVMDGTFRVWSEDASEIRSAVAGSFLHKIDPGASQQITLGEEPPSSTKKLVLSFRGKIGSDDGAVSGVVVPYGTDPQCGSTISAQGQNEGLATYMDLGTKAGKVSWQFEAYNIPDELTIKERDTKTTKASTNGRISGFKSGSWEYDGSTSKQKLDIAVTANSDPNTHWTLAVSCPGQAVKPVNELRSVRFWLKGNTCNARAMVRVDGGVYSEFSGFINKNVSTGSGTHLIQYYRSYTPDSCSLFGQSSGELVYIDDSGEHPLPCLGLCGSDAPGALSTPIY